MRLSLAAPASIIVDAPGDYELPPTRLQAAAWYAAFAVYAGLVAIFSFPSHDRVWGTWAVGGYLAAALIAFRWRSHGRDAALLVSMAGALLGPMTWLATRAQPTPDVQVVSRAGVLLLRHGTPYLDPAQIVGQTDPLAYNPYLPFMTVFGLPKAFHLPGLLGDTRLWVTAVTLTLIVLAFRVAGRSEPFRLGVFALATPVAAFPIAVGITDPPVLAIFCLTLALLARPGSSRRIWLAAVVLGMACAMKATAWPALPVFAVMLAARDGARVAARFAGAVAGTAALLFVSFAPAIITKPAALIQNTVLFPLGLTRAKTPAVSPLPGHLLATTGPAGHTLAMLLLVASGVAVVASLVVRPPADSTAAAVRLAIALTLMFAFSPTTRFGYFTYPLGILGWIALCGWLPISGWAAAVRWHLKLGPPRRTGPGGGRAATAKLPAQIPPGSAGR